MATKRKRRCDRAYLIYKITCSVNLECYVGLVVRDRTVKRSLTRRLNQHLDRALGVATGWSVPKKWALHVAIRKHGREAFSIELLEVCRGKALAHQREIELMREHRVTLNTKIKRS